MEYRHELKFLVSDAQIETVRYRLKPLMRPDIHQKEDGYTIRSLYFDDFYDSCMRENEDGIDNRKKFRIRIYDSDDSVIKLEKKIKFRGMTKKVEADISREDCLVYLSGGVPELLGEDPPLKKELYGEIRGRGLRPVTIVEYDRYAFVEERGNVRITFDRNISCCERTECFFHRTILRTPLLQRGLHILEVKYDELLPEYISGVLNLGSLQRSAFSKYWYSRNYSGV